MAPHLSTPQSCLMAVVILWGVSKTIHVASCHSGCEHSQSIAWIALKAGGEVNE